MKPAPIPWILCGPGWPPEMTGEWTGSTATMRTAGLRAFQTLPTPVMVPPVPTPATKMSMPPSVSRHSSSAVVASWIAGLAGFSNCCGITAPGISSSSSAALRMAPFIPSAAGVRMSSAPSSLSTLRRSSDTLSGIAMTHR